MAHFSALSLVTEALERVGPPNKISTGDRTVLIG